MSFVTHKLYTDGAARGNPGPAGAGAVLLDGRNQIATLTRFLGEKLTNNEAEYRALILGLELALKNRAGDLEVFMDSQLIVNQVTGQYKIKQARLYKLYTEVARLAKQFSSIKFSHIPRKENKQADRLANLALDDVEMARKLRKTK